MNDRNEAEAKKLRGATGAMSSDADAVVLVFENGQLGGIGNIAGTVDNYGIIEPGDNAVGELAFKNYAMLTAKANLFVRPASILRFKISSVDSHDKLSVSGNVKYYNIRQDFSQSSDMPQVELVVADDAKLNVGDEFVVLTAAGKTSQTGEWQFELKTPEKYTWALEERVTDSGYSLVVRLVSLDNSGDADGGDDGGNDDDQTTDVMGPFYDDVINDNTDRTPLRSYAAKNNKLVGTAISTWKNDVTNANLPETKEIGTQFNLLVAENEMKFDALQPSRGEFNFWAADNLVNFAERNKMTVRGHCLAWHQQVPEWVSSDGKKNDKNWTRAEALELLKIHISQVMNHFKGKVVEWDVVNECLDDNQTSIRSNPDGYDLRATVWQRAIGNDYIDSAFVYARQADPDALLYLNDYGVELQGKAKTTAFYNLAMRLKKAGIPIDGVGLQCHFSIGEVDSVKLDNTIARFEEAGLKCIITELDMGVPSTTDKDLEEQARLYRVITDIVLNHDNCPSMVIWGLKDNDSWRSESNPLLYDASLSKKPAYYAVRSALRHRTIVNDTGIEYVPIKQIDNNAVYDLRGCRVDESRLKPGIYIKGGKKVVR
jgi:GH35 family endo-1,4-beta-xylanase